MNSNGIFFSMKDVFQNGISNLVLNSYRDYQKKKISVWDPYPDMCEQDRKSIRIRVNAFPIR